MKTEVLISLGSNLGDKKANLQTAADCLSKVFGEAEKSPIVKSKAVDYLNQPDFLNQILSFWVSENKFPPHAILEQAFKIERFMGRKRSIPKGPRIIDIDILFYGELEIQTKDLIIPHPGVFERSFIIQPLKKLSSYENLKKRYDFNHPLGNTCQFI
ncbi:MAG: 2-amino-4-hydroxy-6-hydroxymethyldihydropteridine diphosphokinase [Halobacteriovoraceae bacterium]|nr:2-amino-4-hydroxy-6-hydroxymethyldihydropteridine diphosphokinase [Halobacteriovoraceae bacterium]